jgi:hypothetical protein
MDFKFAFHAKKPVKYPLMMVMLAFVIMTMATACYLKIYATNGGSQQASLRKAA